MNLEQKPKAPLSFYVYHFILTLTAIVALYSYHLYFYKYLEPVYYCGLGKTISENIHIVSYSNEVHTYSNGEQYPRSVLLWAFGVIITLWMSSIVIQIPIQLFRLLTGFDLTKRKKEYEKKYATWNKAKEEKEKNDELIQDEIIELAAMNLEQEPKPPLSSYLHLFIFGLLGIFVFFPLCTFFGKYADPIYYCGLEKTISENIHVVKKSNGMYIYSNGEKYPIGFLTGFGAGITAMFIFIMVFTTSNQLIKLLTGIDLEKRKEEYNKKYAAWRKINEEKEKAKDNQNHG